MATGLSDAEKMAERPVTNWERPPWYLRLKDIWNSGVLSVESTAAIRWAMDEWRRLAHDHDELSDQLTLVVAERDEFRKRLDAALMGEGPGACAAERERAEAAENEAANWRAMYEQASAKVESLASRIESEVRWGRSEQQRADRRGALLAQIYDLARGESET